MPHQEIDPANRHLGKVMRVRLTPAELLLWRHLKGRQLMGLKFRRQAPVGPYILDFFCPEAKIAVELNGGGHGRHHAVVADAQRDAWLAEHGILTLRFVNENVLRDVALVCDAILAEARPRLTGG
jgi:very-short-patch-repair endonuclease